MLKNYKELKNLQNDIGEVERMLKAHIKSLESKPSNPRALEPSDPWILEPFFYNMFEKLLQNKIIKLIVTKVQKVLITFLLTLLYIFGLGITYVYVAVFKRRFISNKKKEAGITFFKKADDYEADMDKSMRQS